MALNGNGNRIWNSPEMPADTWFKLQIGQYFEDKKYVYKIWINDELKLSVINNLPMIFEGVNGIIGNAYGPESNWKPAAGRYKDFNFTSFYSTKPAEQLRREKEKFNEENNRLKAQINQGKADCCTPGILKCLKDHLKDVSFT